MCDLNFFLKSTLTKPGVTSGVNTLSSFRDSALLCLRVCSGALQGSASPGCRVQAMRRLSHKGLLLGATCAYNSLMSPLTSCPVSKLSSPIPQTPQLSQEGLAQGIGLWEAERHCCLLIDNPPFLKGLTVNQAAIIIPAKGGDH